MDLLNKALPSATARAEHIAPALGSVITHQINKAIAPPDAPERQEPSEDWEVLKHFGEDFSKYVGVTAKVAFDALLSGRTRVGQGRERRSLRDQRGGCEGVCARS